MLFKCPSCGAELEVSLRGDKPAEAWRGVRLETLGLSTRAFNSLANCRKWDGDEWKVVGPQTAGEVADLTDGELLRFCNFGRVSLREVRLALEGLKARSNGF